MFEDFSEAYYLGRLYVEPHEIDTPAIQSDDFEAVSDGIYDEEGPLVMKVERHHLVVDGDETVPRGTLGVPPEVVNELDMQNPPTLKEVLLAKPDHAARLLRMSGDVQAETGG